MGLIKSYALLDTSNGRFPWSLLAVVADMMQHDTIYAWASTLLEKVYRELFFYSQDHISSLYVTITLKAWGYEHIFVAHHLGILIPSFEIHITYPAGVMRWREDFQIHPTDHVH